MIGKMVVIGACMGGAIAMSHSVGQQYTVIRPPLQPIPPSVSRLMPDQLPQQLPPARGSDDGDGPLVPMTTVEPPTEYGGGCEPGIINCGVMRT